MWQPVLHYDSNRASRRRAIGAAPVPIVTYDGRGHFQHRRRPRPRHPADFAQLRSEDRLGREACQRAAPTDHEEGSSPTARHETDDMGILHWRSKIFTSIARSGARVGKFGLNAGWDFAKEDHWKAFLKKLTAEQPDE
eukprot:7660290-Pyramimonas_sp.AAC.1